MRRLPRQVIGPLLMLALLGCEVPGQPPAPTTVRWALERFETQSAPVPLVPVDSSGREITESATPRPTPVATPTPPASGGGGASAPAGPPRGRVFAYRDLGTAPVPLAGATVWTSDGRSAVSGEDGRFTFSGGWPQDGTWVVHHPSYHASTVVGLAADGPLEFHVKANTAIVGPPSPSGDHTFQVTGRVVDGDGNPLEAVTVLMNAKDGSFGTPGFTAADGTFSMKVLAHGETVEEAAFVAVDYDTQAWMGVAHGVTVAADRTPVDFNASAPGADDFAIAPVTHTLRLNVTDVPADMRARTYVDLVVPGLMPMPLFGDENAVGLAELPGVNFTVRAYAADSFHTRETAYVREKLAIDFRNPETALDIALLPPPVVHPIPAGPLAAVTWDPVDDASGYEVRLDRVDARGFQWEGYTTATSLPFRVPGRTPSGRYALKVSAWEAEGLTPRRIASTGRSELRVMPNANSYRVSTTETRVEF